MGRTSKRQSAGKGSDTPASAAKNQKSRQYKAGIYARLSADIIVSVDHLPCVVYLGVSWMHRSDKIGGVCA